MDFMIVCLISKKEKGEKMKTLSDLTKEELINLYYSQGLSSNKIAEMYNTSHTSVTKLMDRFELYRPQRKKRDSESAKKELLAFYKEYGKFSSADLMAVNSGLERYIRVQHEGLRAFCSKFEIDYILNSPKKTSWTNELAIAKIKEIHQEEGVPVTRKLLCEKGVGGLYQWISKKRGGYKEFCRLNGLLGCIEVKEKEDSTANGEVIKTPKTFWNDALCFRLIKNLFLEKGEPVSPELLKRKHKGAYGYIYEKHGGLFEFADAFDLHEYITEKRAVLDDEKARKLIKEAYYLKKGPVNASWLMQNGYYRLFKYISAKGGGAFIEGARLLGLDDYAVRANTSWNDELALDKINELYSCLGHPLANKDFEINQLTGLRDWIIDNYTSLQNFFEIHGMRDKYVVLGEDYKARWAMGIRFEKIAKEAVECLFGDVIYNKVIPNTRLRPDFVIQGEGLWIDAKLSTDAYYFDETVSKYTSHELCRELWLLCLEGGNRTPKEENVKIIKIKDWYAQLKEQQREDVIEKIEKLRLDLAELNRR